MHGGKACGHGNDRVGDIMCERAGCAMDDDGVSNTWIGNPKPSPRTEPKMMAHGGDVTVDDDGEELTGLLPNEFDVYALEDPDFSEADYTGANSGDEKGNKDEDERRRDILREVMSRRRGSRGRA